MGTAIAKSGYTDSQIRLIKNTIAKDTNEDEFNLFFEAARSYGLDPFRKQILPMVFNKDKPDKRQMAIIVSRDGYRVMAQRCKNYRPAEEPATIEYSKEAVHPVTNPKGIVKATVYLRQQDNQGNWFKVAGEAYWDEFAAIKGYNDNQYLDGNWKKMPVVMITKCAESQALRAGWPDQFGGVYSEEEMHKAEADMTASEAIERHNAEHRAKLLGGKSIAFVFDETPGTIEYVPVGQVHDRCEQFIRENDAETVWRWDVRNKDAMRQFWAESAGDALNIKAMIEEKTKNVGEAA